MPRRGLAMNSPRLGVRTDRELGGVMVRVSRLEAESRRRESAAEVLRSRPVWALARASPKPPMKRWRAEVLLPGLVLKETSLSVARMSRSVYADDKWRLGRERAVASVEAPSSWVRTCWRRVRVSAVRAELMEEKDSGGSPRCCRRGGRGQ